MDFKAFYAGQDDNDRRLDKIIRKFLPDLSLSEIYKLIRKGLIKVNGKKAKQDQRIFLNDELKIAAFLLDNEKAFNKDSLENSLDFEKENKESAKKNRIPAIVYQNQDLIFVSKAYDITVHGDENSLDKIIQKNFSNNTSLSFTPGPLHRLDRKTSGILCFSLSLNGARWFTENIQNHNIQKKYLGILQGKLPAKEIWEDFIQKDENSKNFHTVKISSSQEDLQQGKRAYTEIYPMAYGKYKNQPVTLALIDIKTGRTHQIRSQCALHGYSLLGDTAYNGAKLEGKSRDFYLHAFELLIPKNNPFSLPEKLVCPPAADFTGFLKDCGIIYSDL